MKGIMLALLFFLPTLAYAAPSVEFVCETHDFGAVAPGEPLEYTFEFTNTGTEELVIERVEST